MRWGVRRRLAAAPRHAGRGSAWILSSFVNDLGSFARIASQSTEGLERLGFGAGARRTVYDGAAEPSDDAVLP
jgi:hypothetical protein